MCIATNISQKGCELRSESMKEILIIAGKGLVSVLSIFALYGFTLFLYYTYPSGANEFFPLAVAVIWFASLAGFVFVNMGLWDI